MDMDISKNDITDNQVEKLEELLLELKDTEGSNDTKFSGDDKLIILSVTDAANYIDGKENLFLKNIVHIESSYKV